MKTSRSESFADHDEMIDALRRSGYLIESQISEMLSQSGFFVETNQVIRDPITGKSREIDLLAELYSPREDNIPVVARIKFVFEAKNNPFPLVLLTQLKPTPNIEIYESVREVITPNNPKADTIEEGFYGALFDNETEPVFTQYCTFKRKRDSAKSELMALHPDDLHDGLAKIVQYCDEQIAFWQGQKTDRYIRDFLFLPVIVLGGKLFELVPDLNTTLKQVQVSRLLYNYHLGEETKCAIVYVATQEGFGVFINNLIRMERKIEEHLLEQNQRASTKSGSP
jgi:hypothetical protein